MHRAPSPVRILVFGCAALMTLSGFACSPLSTTKPTDRPNPPAAALPKPPPTTDRIADLIAAHNQSRADFHLPPLAKNPRLQLAAQQHAQEMADHDFMTHLGSDGSSPFDRIKRLGYLYRRAGENVAEGQKSVSEVMIGWMHSPRHRDNILGNYTDIGVGYATDSKGITFWCVDFGMPWPPGVVPPQQPKTQRNPEPLADR